MSQENESATTAHPLSAEQVRELGPTGEAMYAQMHGSLPPTDVSLASVDAGSNEAQSEAPAAETPAPQRDYAAEVAQLATGLDRMHEIYRELANNLCSDKIFDSLVAGLSCHPNFVELVRKLVLESNAEFISSHQQHAHGPELVINEQEGINHYTVGLSREPLEHSMLRAGVNGDDHPTAPGKVEAFILHNGQWRPVGLPPIMGADIAKELKKANALPYVYYWIDLTAYSNAPLSEDSVAVATSENDDGQQAG